MAGSPPEGRDPFATPQREIERQWERALSLNAPPPVVRDPVRTSWSRALEAHVDPMLACAPRTRSADLAERAQLNAAWLPTAEALVHESDWAPDGGDHVVAIFDADGVMLACHGDPWVRAAMAEINFAPGGLWSEASVGTNGPGTALVLGQPVHILGAEHFCRAWHPWQCAATPLHDPFTGRRLGAIDVSGPTRATQRHTLELVRALGLAVERTLLAHGLMRRMKLLRVCAAERARRPADDLAFVDHAGIVVSPGRRGGGELCEGTVVVGLRHDGALAPAEQARLGVRALAPVTDGGELLGWRLVLGGACSLPAPAPPRRAPSPPPTPARGTRYTFAHLIGHSTALAEVRRMAEVAARNDLPVLLLGESGVGKEVIAQAIHAASRRVRGPFVAVNCATLPPTLLESELFGYAPGAFTGAARGGSAGRFEAADGGTLFLDEIDELSHGAQAALLRVLQEGEISRVGSPARRRVDVRVIAATHEAKSATPGAGRLRRDLYYRLAVLPCVVPPLRDRREDLPLLVAHFLERAAGELGVPAPALDEDVLARLAAHDWPGNVRELENLVRRLVAVADGAIGVADLPAELRMPARAAGNDATSGDERVRLQAALEASPTLGEAARALGIGRSTLYRWMERHGLKPQRTFGGKPS